MSARLKAGARAAIIAMAALAGAACNVGGDANQADRTKAAAPAADEPPPKPPLKPAPNSASAPLDEPDTAGEPPAASEPGSPNGLTRAWFAGKWTDTGDCADAGQFAPSGIFQLPDGSRGMWNIQNGRLVTQQGENRNLVRLRKIDENTVGVLNEDGSVGRSTRC